MNKEQRGIYNVTFGNEEATPIFKDIEAIEDAVIEYIAMYVKGYHNVRRDIGVGAEHIKMHLEDGSDGEITIKELVNLGHSLREYLKNFKEPFIDEKGAKIYEWENNERVRFRAVVSRVTDGYLNKMEENYQKGGSQPPLSPFDDIIITFYSDRNINKQMEFKNPKVEEYYQKQREKLLQPKDSALARMQQKCEAYAKSLQDKNLKSQMKDKSKDSSNTR